MNRLLVLNHVSLDGVMQSPGRVDEDTRDGFTHGAWADADNDEVMGRLLGERMGGAGALLFGRRTYEDLLTSWNARPDSPFTPALNAAPKYVASTTLREPLPWPNSTVLRGDVPSAVAELKEHTSLTIMGSGTLIASLLPHGSIDEYLLMIHPLVLGSGRRLFPADGTFDELRLVDSVTTTTGVIIATYHRRDPGPDG
jgi:dihydrofolate reductase